jgi:DNA-binding transcriptional MerR regulator
MLHTPQGVNVRDQFSTLDIVKALDIPRERLREWLVRGYVRPSVSAEGQGTRAIFTRTDVYTVALFRRLLEIGFRREEAGKFVRKFQEREKDAPEQQRTVYLIFRVGGKGGPRSLSLARGGWKIALETGAVEWGNIPTSDPQAMKAMNWGLNQMLGRAPIKAPGDIEAFMAAVSKSAGWADRNWEMLQIVNLSGLYERIDAALNDL